MSRNLLIYHDYKSTGFGGIEVLIRSFESVFCSLNVTEFFYRSSGQAVEENSAVRYVNFSRFLPGIPFRGLSIISRMLLYFYLLVKAKRNDVVIFFKPINLIFVPSSVMRRCNVILVQSNRCDEFFPGAKLTRLLAPRLKELRAIVPYTESDKLQILDVVPFLSGERLRPIARASRIEISKHLPRFSRKLVTISRIEERQKNFSDMVQIMSHLGEGYTLDIFGVGPREEIDALEELIRKDSRISFCGPSYNVTATLRDYSVFIMTSHYEGFGQTLVEARSQGLPLVVFDSFPSLSEIVTDGVNGFKVPIGAADEFAEKISIITSDSSVYKDFCFGAHELAPDTEREIIEQQWRSLVSGLCA
jgi:glycosyltransferase involved in cell wall biosynthesis